MSEILEVTMPIKTVSEANTRGHWRVKYNRQNKQKQDFVVFWRQAKVPKISFPCKVTFTRFASRICDSDNLVSCFKACRDQLCAILGIDDGDTSKITFHYAQEKTKRRENYFTVEIENE